MKNKDQLLSKQYNKYPYPRPVKNIDIEIIKKGKIPIADPNFSWHLLWPELKYNNNNLNILVAGCGTHQAAIIARLNPQNFITGIDISNKSIIHEKNLKKLHNIKNLKLINDDFRSVKFNEKFDYIISTGVIHHLKDPGTALNFFQKNLKEEGVVYLMVYGSKKRFALNETIKVLKKFKFNQNQESILKSRKMINNLNDNHPAKLFAFNSTDMQSKEGVVDLLLNYQEKHYDIDTLIKIIETEKLYIKNFTDGSICGVTKFFLSDTKMIKKIRNLKYIDKYKIGQILNWNDTKIILILNKNKKNSVTTNKVNIKKCFFYHNRSVLLKIGYNYLDIVEKKSLKKFRININEKIKIDWKLTLSGQITLNSIIKTNDISVRKEIYDLFNLLIENKFIDFSFHKIFNYIKYIPKI